MHETMGRGLLAVAVAVGSTASGLAAQSAAAPDRRASAPPQVTETTLELEDGSTLRYAIAVPDGYEASDGDARPLVLALHPGGGGSPYYGGAFMRSIVEPALRSWGGVVVAPDAPGRSWTTERSERALLALVDHVLEEHAIDRDRVLVTGFSMGGRGTWRMAVRHPDVFTGAVVMAGSPGRTDVDEWADTPLYVIHSPDDEVVPFEAAEEAYLALAERGHPVEMRVLPGAGHYAMGAYVPALRLAGEWMLARWAGRPR